MTDSQFTFSFHTWKKIGPKKMGDLPRIIQLMSNGIRVKSQKGLMQIEKNHSHISDCFQHSSMRCQKKEKA